MSWQKDNYRRDSTMSKITQIRLSVLEAREWFWPGLCLERQGLVDGGMWQGPTLTGPRPGDQGASPR